MAYRPHIAFLLFVVLGLALLGWSVWPLLATVRGIGF
jgi:hypothetical protein